MSLLIMFIVFLSIFATFARSIWLAVILIMFLGSITIYKRYSIYIISLFIAVWLLIFFLLPDLQERFLSIFDPNQNETRLNLWVTSWNIFKDNLLIGVGQAHFNTFFELYKVPGYYDVSGHAHNDYLNIMVMNGLLGIVSWLGIWGSWFYYSLKSYSENILNDFDKKIVLGSILGIAGILFASFFQCYYRDLENNIFWWFLAASTIQIIINSKSSDYQ